MRQLPPGHLGVFTSAEAFDAGWTRSALRHAVGRGRIVAVRRGMWAAPGNPTHPGDRDRALLQTSVAAAREAHGTVVSHLGAAIGFELPTWAPYPRPCVTVVGRTRISLSGVHVHRTGRGFTGRLVDGVVLTDPIRTLVDVAREFGVESGLVSADAAVRRGLVTRGQLTRATRSLRGTGAADAKLMAEMVDGRSESPLESRSRWQFRVHDITPPQPQTHVYDRAGTFLGRVDFFWPEGVVGEVDGSQKYRDHRDAGVKEKWRQELLERTGLLVVRWGARDLSDFRETAARICDRRARVQRPGWPHDWIVTSGPKV